MVDLLHEWCLLLSGKSTNTRNKIALECQGSLDVTTTADLHQLCIALCVAHLQVHPSDERVAAVILEIADFMLEFSTLGHEEAADIPQFVHPRIPNEVQLTAKGVDVIAT